MTDKKLKELLKYWKAFYDSKGVSDDFSKQCLDYAENLIKQDLPVIFEMHHLSLLLGLSEEYLFSVVYSPKSHYREFSIPKKSGGRRKLSSPHHTLKYVQQWIYQNILYKIKVNYCTHGFRTKKSILTNANIHVGANYLLKLDLKDFFPSISINQVIMVFNKLGYSYNVSFYLASLCCMDDCLPQGAPTSPALSNIVARQLDNRMLGLCKKMKYRYTRYADDLAFSGDNIKHSFVDTCRKIITECNFTLNENKIKLYKPEGARTLTGLSLANHRIRIPRDYRRQLSAELHFVKKYGIGEHMKRNKIKNPHYLETLIGMTEFWLSVEPQCEFAKSSLDYLHLLYKQKYSS